ncbi:Transposase, MuDR, plant [Sesbania bispinosa]|nr:Transposase, MuDR, plant [Sesbania bispinosa]
MHGAKACVHWVRIAGGTGDVDQSSGDTRPLLIANVEHGHDMEDEYHNEELDSDYCSSGNEDDNKLTYVRFKKEDMGKEFKFKLGIEFSSLKEFKDAILEHSVLNGREIIFEKNDKVRVRVRCKQTCDFVALISKVGGSSTYRMKTLVSTNTCGRVFNNKNAKSKWVATKVADRFRSGQGVRFATLKEKLAKYPGEVLPKPRKRLYREVQHYANWFPTWAGGLKFEVTHSMAPQKFVVDLAK